MIKLKFSKSGISLPGTLIGFAIFAVISIATIQIIVSTSRFIQTQLALNDIKNEANIVIQKIENDLKNALEKKIDTDGSTLQFYIPIKNPAGFNNYWTGWPNSDSDQGDWNLEYDEFNPVIYSRNGNQLTRTYISTEILSRNIKDFLVFKTIDGNINVILTLSKQIPLTDKTINYAISKQFTLNDYETGYTYNFGSFCGNGICDVALGEDFLNCGDCSPVICNNNGTCDILSGENIDNCPNDCSICGDNILSLSEECDDGNIINEDGCSSNCKNEICGDGIVQSSLGEDCDDGNNEPGDGCNPACKNELPVSICGNGIIEAGEFCDDGNLINGDGCSSKCKKERRTKKRWKK